MEVSLGPHSSVRSLRWCSSTVEYLPPGMPVAVEEVVELVVVSVVVGRNSSGHFLH